MRRPVACRVAHEQPHAEASTERILRERTLRRRGVDEGDAAALQRVAGATDAERGRASDGNGKGPRYPPRESDPTEAGRGPTLAGGAGRGSREGPVARERVDRSRCVALDLADQPRAQLIRVMPKESVL